MAAYSKTIACLANSRKRPSGRCIAGREVTGDGLGPWVRPVSARPSQEVSVKESRYEDGTDPAVLDIIEIEMLRPAAASHQQENHVIDDGCPWVKIGRLEWDQLLRAVEDPKGPLWANGYSSGNGLNDRIPISAARAFNYSLMLVQPTDLSLAVVIEGGDFRPPRRRLRADFSLANHAYSLVVTDPWAEGSYLPRGEGSTHLDGSLLCVSLTEEFHEYAYKLVAAVITQDRTGG